MEEKKLTDETVNATVKSLKWVCNQIPNNLGDSNEERMLKCICLYCEQGIALIHRLQDENAEYDRKLEDGELVSKDWHDEQVIHLQTENEELKRSKFGNWKVKFFKAQEEIERLTEVISEFRQEFITLNIEKFELQKQVGAWKERVRELETAWEISSSNEEKLQKQVEELMERNNYLENENKELWDSYHKGYAVGYGYGKQDALSADIEETCIVENETSNYQQAVKDTVKEIFQGLNKWLKQAISDSYDKSVKGSAYEGGRNRAFHEVKDLVKKVAESKGVEVE